MEERAKGPDMEWVLFVIVSPSPPRLHLRVRNGLA
jgi:hypothetical protein